MDIVKLHQLIDQWAAEERAVKDEGPDTSQAVPDVPARVLPKDKRVVRTKTMGDKVFVLDEVKKSRQWVTSPQILEGLGFEMGDVVELEESEFLKYQMGPAIYRLDAPA